MRDIIKKVGLGIGAVALLAFSVVGIIGNSALAATPTTDRICQGVKGATNEDCGDNLAGPDKIWTTISQITTWILIAVGIICVIFIIFGGIRYATSGGDAEKVKSAKNTLLYAIIGLAIALLATVIVNIVVGFSEAAKTPNP